MIKSQNTKKTKEERLINAIHNIKDSNIKIAVEDDNYTFNDKAKRHEEEKSIISTTKPCQTKN